MRKNTFQKIAVALTGIALSFTACTTDVYEPKTGPTPNEEGVSQELKDFGFATRKSVNLSVNYDAPGFKTLVKIFKENPVDEAGYLKEGIEPVYSAFTDDNGKLDAEMYIPTSVEEAYLYTDMWGLPTCVKLESNAEGWTYDGTRKERLQSKASVGNVENDYLVGDRPPYQLNNHTYASGGDFVYAMCFFDSYGYTFNFSNVPYVPNTVTSTSSYKNEQIGVISERTQKYFRSYEGKKTDLLKPAAITNIKVKTEGTLDLIFLAEMGAYKNVLGYYYYQEGKAPQTEEELKAIKKYVVIPEVDVYGNGPLKVGDTFRLKYFGEDGLSEGSDKFPANTVIGWFIVSNGYQYTNSKSSIKKWDGSQERIYFLSNDQDQKMRFVAVQDQKTGMVVLGCEDQPESLFNRLTEDYTDILFFVKSDDATLDNEGKPVIPDEDAPQPSESFAVSGILAFEDIWPTGGDYDMNDVALEYSRNITFNKDNKAIGLEEKFKFIQKAGAASMENYFAYQVTNVGTATDKGGCEFEAETNSFIFPTSAKTTSGQEFTVTRTFDGTVDKDVLAKDFNPYIIVGNLGDNRKEVHLPMGKATTKADQKIIGTLDEAYYMAKDGKFPFAIDIAKTGFILSREARPISATYPRFATWASSFGTKDADWYNDEPKDN